MGPPGAASPSCVALGKWLDCPVPGFQPSRGVSVRFERGELCGALRMCELSLFFITESTRIVPCTGAGARGSTCPWDDQGSRALPHLLGQGWAQEASLPLPCH